MTLNSNYPGAVRMAARGKLQGPERGLDALVGVVILVAELAIGLLSVYALYNLGITAGAAKPELRDRLDIGFQIAVYGGGALVLITTIVFLARVAAGRRSWPAPLWGAILMTVALLIGYFVMAG